MAIRSITDKLSVAQYASRHLQLACYLNCFKIIKVCFDVSEKKYMYIYNKAQIQTANKESDVNGLPRTGLEPPPSMTLHVLRYLSPDNHLLVV